MDQSTQTFFDQRGRGFRFLMALQIFHMLIRSGDIRDQSRKLSKIANISGTDQQIENRNSSWKSTTPATLDEKSWCTLVHKRKSY